MYHVLHGSPFELTVDHIKLYAEPSSLHYIRTHFDVEKIIIVSPDAGGAKR